MRRNLSALALVAALFAATPCSARVAEDAAYVRYLLVDAFRTEDAVVAASELVARNRRSILAHDAYLLVAFSTGEGPRLREQYRRWYEAQPGSVLRRVTYAATIGIYNMDAQDHVAEVEALLDPLPEGGDERAYAYRILSTLYLMTGDAEALAATRADLSEEDPGRDVQAVWILAERIRSGTLDEPLARAFRDVYVLHPHEFAWVAVFWDEDVAGPALESGRQQALADAATLAEDDDPVRVAAAQHVFFMAGEHEASDRADARLADLDPEGDWDPADVRDVREASKRLSDEVALANLEELDAGVPATGGARMSLEWQRAWLLRGMDRSTEAVDAWAVAYEANPDIGDTFFRKAVRTFGSLAASSDHGQERALAQVDETLAAIEGQDWGDRYELRALGRVHWEKFHAKEVAWMLRVRAELLESLGRDEEALVERQRALRLFDDARIEVALGHAFLARGREAAAFHHLSRGFARGGGDEETLPALRQLYPSQPIWCPGGLAGYLADLKAAPDDDDPLARSQARYWEQAAVRRAEAPGLRGTTFPDLAYVREGETFHLSDHDGPLLIELWNSG
jgi:tetratricopeptide (TPR) repeat protein